MASSGTDLLYQVVERRFSDHAEAMLYESEHYCATYPRQCGEEWLVFELVPVKGEQL